MHLRSRISSLWLLSARNSRLVSPDSLGASGGQIVGWRGDIFDCSDLLVGEFLILIKLTISRTGQLFCDNIGLRALRGRMQTKFLAKTS